MSACHRGGNPTSETTLVRWEALRSAGPVDVERLREFVNEFFDQPEDELVGCEPLDWEPSVSCFEHDFY